jgi:hypothetical protein
MPRYSHRVNTCENDGFDNKRFAPAKPNPLGHKIHTGNRSNLPQIPALRAVNSHVLTDVEEGLLLWPLAISS